MTTITPIGRYIGTGNTVDAQAIAVAVETLAKYRYIGKPLIRTTTSHQRLYGDPTKTIPGTVKNKDLEKALSINSSSVINCLEYVDYQNAQHLNQELLFAMKWCKDSHINALQITGSWPDPRDLDDFRKHYALPIILQLDKRELELCHDHPTTVAKRLQKDYAGIISHVVLNCDRSKGAPIDIPCIENYIIAIEDCAAEFNISIKGTFDQKYEFFNAGSLIRKHLLSIDIDIDNESNYHYIASRLHDTVGLYI